MLDQILKVRVYKILFIIIFTLIVFNQKVSAQNIEFTRCGGSTGEWGTEFDVCWSPNHDMNLLPTEVELHIDGKYIGTSSTYQENWAFGRVFEFSEACSAFPEFVEIDFNHPDIPIGYGYKSNSIVYIVTKFSDGSTEPVEVSTEYNISGEVIYISKELSENYVDNYEEAKSICSIPQEPLYDIKGNVFEKFIRNLYEDEIIGGYSDGSFKPDAPVTRGAITKFIKQSYGIETDTSCGDFPDVDASNVFHEYVTSLKCTGIVDGYSDGGYHSDEIVTRAQATKMIINAARVKTGDDKFFPKTEDDIFPDVPRENVFYKFIMSAYSNGIVNGQSDGSFNPDGEMTRGATSKVIDISRKEL